LIISEAMRICYAVRFAWYNDSMKNFGFASVVASLLFAAVLPVVVFADPASGGYSETQAQGISMAIQDRLWQRTDYWFGNGSYQRSIKEDRLITEADPHFLEPYATGAWLMDSLGHKADAEDYYALGAARNPDRSYAWFNLAFFYFSSLKDYPRAIKTFQLAVNSPDSDINDWRMLAHSYEKNNQLNDAIVVWQKLHQIYPLNSVVLLNLNRDEQKIETGATQSGQ
jgi:tetratricopeptide (TPR) repeat protein